METTTPRHNESKGSAIMLGNAALSLLNIGVGVLTATAIPYPFVMPVIHNLLFVALAVAIRRGHHWAKLMFLMLFALAVVLTLFQLDKLGTLFRAHPRSVIAMAIQFALNVWALTVLFRKPQPRATA